MSENKKSLVTEALEQAKEMTNKQISEKISIESDTNKLLEGQEYDSIRIVNEIKFFLKRHVIDGLEAGKRIYVLKRNEKHGNFLNLLEDIGILPRTAQYYMAIWVKFAKYEMISHLGATKLIAALSIPDEEIDKLEREGSLIGIPKEKLNILSTREFQAEINKWKKRTEETEKREEKLKTEVRNLQEKFDNLFNPDAEDIEKEVREKMTGYFLSIKGTMVFARWIADQIHADPEKFPESCRAQVAGFASLVMRVATEFWSQLQELSVSPYGAEEMGGDVDDWQRPVEGEWNPQLVPEAHEVLTIEELEKRALEKLEKDTKCSE